MASLSLKTYDEVEDNSPLYCLGGAVLLGLLAGWEFFQLGRVNLRFVLMALTTVLFIGVAMWLRRRHVLWIMVGGEGEADERLMIGKRGEQGLVILKSDLAYLKQEQGRVVIHYHEGEDLKRTFFSTKGANKKKVTEAVDYLKTWGE